MARFTQPTTDSTSSNIGTKQTYQPQGGTLDGGTQPTFNGQPGFYGIFTKIGDLVSFSINVDFSNITGFGTGQYYMTVPVASDHNVYIRGGHLHDETANKNYGISGEIEAGSNILKLYYTASNGQDAAFTSTNPVTLTTQDNFHIQGTYINSVE